MEKVKIKSKFEGIKEIQAKSGKQYNVLCFIIDHKLVDVFDYNNTLTTLLLDNKVEVMSDINLILSVYITKDGKFGVKVDNVEF